jgi:hypothetical protein
MRDIALNFLKKEVTSQNFSVKLGMDSLLEAVYLKYNDYTEIEVLSKDSDLILPYITYQRSNKV